MRRIMLTIAYDGTNYCGWQTQPNGLSVEEVINKHLSEFLNEDIKVIGASRTDSGVHALGNVAVFDTDSKIPGDKFSFALNKGLPEDIVIQGSREVDKEFHPRFNKNSKIYEYKILNTTFDIPTMRNHAYFYHMKLDLELMRQGAAFLVGEHDFKSFCTPRTNVTDFVREIKSIDIFKEDKVVRIRVEGNGFLYNMVRIIVGTLIQVGSGVFLPEHVKEILEEKDRTVAGPTAPARGLTLINISYKNY